VEAFLFLAALVGGALNSVAGGGSFIALPALIYAGVSPVTANATTTFALWPGSVASAIAYRGHFSTSRSRLGVLLAVSVFGGLLGGVLLVRTSDTGFLRLLPWLMLAATLTFSFGGRIQQRLRRVSGQHVEAPGTRHPLEERGTRHPAPGTRHPAPGTRSVPVLPLLIQLGIATYGGYFGGGAGIMMLAMLSIAGLSNVHEMNGLKSLLAVAINAVALIAFMLYGVIEWRPGTVMVAGAIIGGYAGASMARRLDQVRVRQFVIAIGWLMTAYFFIR
jgi:uncharacterized membrane protein YfcA